MGQTYEALGDVLETIGSHDAARESYRVAQQLLSPDMLIGQARLLRKIGKTRENQRAYAEALHIYDEVVDMLENTPTKAQTGWWTEWIEAQNSRLTDYYWLNKVAEMKMLSDRVRPEFDMHATPNQRRLLFANMALMGLRRDRFTVDGESLAYARAILAVPGGWGNTLDDNFARFCAGFILLWHGDLEEAGQLMRVITTKLEQIGEVTTLSRSLAYQTAIFRKLGQVDEARRTSKRTLEVALAGQMLEYIGSAKGHQAWIAWRDGDVEQTLALAEEAYHSYLSGVIIGNIIGWVALWPLIAAETTLDRTESAIEHVKLLLNPKQQPQPDVVRVPLQAALQAWEDHQAEEARRLLLEAIELARPFGYV